jgi:hypothetical protein
LTQDPTKPTETNSQKKLSPSLSKTMSLSKILMDNEEQWKRCMISGGLPETTTQTEFFQNHLPKQACDFTDIFDRFSLKDLFTSDKIVTGLLGNYNSMFLYRQTTSSIPDILVYSNDTYKVFQPLGEPGRDATDYKIGHFMIVTHDPNHTFTLNESLPLTESELSDLHSRRALIEQAYQALFENVPIHLCGDQVIQKAKQLGCPTDMKIRDFLVHQIVSMSEEIRTGRPGYVLTHEGQDISRDKQSMMDQANRAFDRSNQPRFYIQGVTCNSQLVSHIHGFVTNVDTPLKPECVDDYLDLDTLISLHDEKLHDDDDDCELTRTTSVYPGA